MKKTVDYFLIILCTIIFNHWVIGPKNGFVFDDWAYLFKFKFNSITHFINFLPESTYNDRPVGELFLKILFNFFYDKYQLFHLFLLALHILNSILIYQIFLIVIKKLFPKSKAANIIALTTSLIFSSWPKSLMAIQWNSAIFDLLGTTLSLIMIITYLWQPKKLIIKLFRFITIISLFFLSLRTKEMFIVIPVIILIYELLKNRGVIRQNIKKILNITIIAQLIIASIYTVLLLYLKNNNQIVNSTDSPYFMTLNPLTILENLFRYLFLYFNYGSVEFSFTDYNQKSLLLVFAAMTITITFVLVNKTKLKLILPIVLLFPVSLFTVLPLKNLQHSLYLYFPSALLALYLSLLIYSISKQIFKNYQRSKYFSILLVVLLIIIVNTSRSIELYRNFWFSVSENNRKTYFDIQRITQPPPNSTIYVNNVNDPINSFIQGHGAVFWFTYSDPSLKMVLNPDLIPIENKNYLLLEYENGSLKELKRE